MHIKSLSLVNFKNYEQAGLEFSSRVNCFVGNNGVGKTNLLDAIHYLALCKSYFNPVDTQNIRHDAEFAVVQGEFEKEGTSDNIYLGIQKSKRKIFRINKKEYEKLSDHIGLFPLVMISPADSSLIMDGGEERRKFLNGVISQFDRMYLENILNYNRILLQRNKLLKTGNAGRESEFLEVYDDRLSEFGTSVYEKRKDFVGKLSPVFNRFYNYVSGEKEVVSLEYESQLHENRFPELLRISRQKDIILQYTTAGIHRDDLSMLLDGHSLKKIGSQGQQKTYQLALKLGKFEFIKQISGITPILLLDDIFDKFDSLRVEQIIRLVSENDFGQIFITDTDEQRMHQILGRISKDHKIFRIDEKQQITEI